MILIKLGGSVITDKSRYRRFNRRRVSELCKEIKGSGKDVMIVHGAGSFGHVVAKDFRLHEGHLDDGQIKAVVRVSHDVRDLNSMVMTEMIKAGIDAVSVPAGSFLMLDRGKVVGDAGVLRGFLGLGIVPVMFGDVVIDRERGFGICSGDAMIEFLASTFRPEMVVFVSDVDGLYDKDPKRNADAVLIRTVDEGSLDSASTGMAVADVTGGVRSKMETMLRMSSEDRGCFLVNGTVKGRLGSLLSGGDVICTEATGGIV